jgi:hypothetical protein
MFGDALEDGADLDAAVACIERKGMADEVEPARLVLDDLAGYELVDLEVPGYAPLLDDLALADELGARHETPVSEKLLQFVADF